MFSSNLLTDEQLLELIASGESDRIEFKEALSGSSADLIREAICAFANDLPDHQQPGVVFVGVRDDGTILDIDITDQQLINLANMKTDGNIVPPPSMTVEKRMLNAKTVAVVAVQPSDSPPVKYRGRIHVRVGSRRDIATGQDERILTEKRRHGNMPFDLYPIPSSSLRDLNLTQFENEYLPQAFDRQVLEANERTVEERLAATKMVASADSPTPTVMGMLVLGKSPQDFLPGAYIQFLRLDGLELSNDIIDAEEFRGSVTDVLRRLDEKLNSHNRTSVDYTSAALEQRNEIYPLQALHQITRNAVMHRTYEATNAPVKVHWFSDRLEIISPGGPYGLVNARNFGQPGITDYRNPNLAEAMKTLGFVQRFDVGIPTAQRLLNQAGHPELGYDILEDYITVTVKVSLG
ncbi:MAG: putative DNA binding domain-containing protein [Chloroflexi bacterium]|nr:putative DNA binding domain-containing protein [Chloroflexota bacterium]